MIPSDSTPKAANSHAPSAPAQPRSGSGADTAFEAMLRKRQVHPLDIEDTPSPEGLPGKPAD